MTGTRETIEMLDAAWSYADQGFHLIPLIGKVPASDLLPLVDGNPSWKPYLERRNAPEEIRRWFGRAGINVGALTVVSGVVFIDCDTTEDAEWWSWSHPATSMINKTARGVQFGYAVDPRDRTIRNGSGLFGRRIDFRGYGGYVVLPSSRHPSGVKYEKIGRWQLVDVPNFDPAWIAQEIGRPSGSPGRLQSESIEQLGRHIQRIQSIAGNGGHNACFRCACTIAEAGLSFDEAMKLFRSWNDGCAFPRWSEWELRHKMTDAFRRVRAGLTNRPSG